MDNKQLLIIILAIIIAGLIISFGCFYGLSQNKNTINTTNTSNASNTTDTLNNTTAHTANDPIEHVSNDEPVESQSSSEPQYIGEDGEPISEADYKTIQVYGKSANSPEEYEAQKASLGY